MKIKKNFIKVTISHYFTDTPHEGYIDTTRIIALYEDGLGKYGVDAIERSYTVDKESYDKLVEVLYGKTYN